MDSTGLVRTGSTGSIVVSVVASVPGAKPFIDRIKVRMVPGPAARIAVTPGVTRVVAGQRIRLGGKAYSAAGDERGDAMQWRSSAPRIARISSDGVLTGVAPGRATITASVEGATEQVPIQVIANTIT